MRGVLSWCLQGNSIACRDSQPAKNRWTADARRETGGNACKAYYIFEQEVDRGERGHAVSRERADRFELPGVKLPCPAFVEVAKVTRIGSRAAANMTEYRGEKSVAAAARAAGRPVAQHQVKPVMVSQKG